jgi:hypothetical protein
MSTTKSGEKSAMKPRARSKAPSTRLRVSRAGSVKPMSGECDIVTTADGTGGSFQTWRLTC